MQQIPTDEMNRKLGEATIEYQTKLAEIFGTDIEVTSIVEVTPGGNLEGAGMVFPTSLPDLYAVAQVLRKGALATTLAIASMEDEKENSTIQ